DPSRRSGSAARCRCSRAPPRCCGSCGGVERCCGCASARCPGCTSPARGEARDRSAYPGRMRLFVAVYPSEEALEDLAAAVSRSRLGAAAASGVNVRLTARPLWHVTLAFLGEVADERVSAVGEAVREGV